MFGNFFRYNINLTAHCLNEFEILNRISTIIMFVKGYIFLSLLKCIL